MAVILIKAAFGLGSVMIRVLDLRLDIVGSIPAAALSSARNLRQVIHTHLPVLPSSIIRHQHMLGGKQVHRATTE